MADEVSTEIQARVTNIMVWYENQRLEIEGKIAVQALPRRREQEEKIDALRTQLMAEVRSAEDAMRTVMVAELDAALAKRLQAEAGGIPAHRKTVLEAMRKADYRQRSTRDGAKASDRTVITRATTLTAEQDAMLHTVMAERNENMSGAIRSIIQQYVEYRKQQEPQPTRTPVKRLEVDQPLEAGILRPPPARSKGLRPKESKK